MDTDRNGTTETGLVHELLREATVVHLQPEDLIVLRITTDRIITPDLAKAAVAAFAPRRVRGPGRRDQHRSLRRCHALRAGAATADAPMLTSGPCALSPSGRTLHPRR